MLLIMYRWRILPEMEEAFRTDWHKLEKGRRSYSQSVMLQSDGHDIVLIVQFKDQTSLNSWANRTGWERFCAKWSKLKLHGPERFSVLSGEFSESEIRAASKLSLTDRIQITTAAYFGISLAKLKSGDRCKEVAFVRHVAMWLCRKLTRRNDSEIGESFNRERTAAKHGIDRVKAMLHNSYVLPGDDELPGPEGKPLGDVVDEIKRQVLRELAES